MAKRKESVEAVEKTPIPGLIKAFRDYLDKEENFGKPSWFLHTGNFSLDYIISGKVDGTGGWPGGRICELFGPPSTGKTILVAKAGATIQQTGGIFVLGDAENRWDSDFAEVHGVDPGSVIGFCPETVEEFSVRVSELLDKAIESNPIPKMLIVIDSLAALSTLKEVDDVGTKADQGRKAQRLKAAMRVLPAKIRKAGAIFLATNHIIDNVGVTYGPSKTTPGGRAVPFQASVRIELLSTKQIEIKDKARPIGVTMHAKCFKNSITAPFGETYVDVLWSRGVNQYSGLIDIMIDLGIVEQNAGWYTYREKAFREKDLQEVIKEHPELLTDERWVKPYFLSMEEE